MPQRASGPFVVTLTPQPGGEHSEGALMGRLTLDKTYSGDLEGRAIGEMLSARSAIQGSAGYVAMEKFTGNLRGRRGSFALQHFGLMDRGTQQLQVVVVPGSGTGELAGLSGTMKIFIEEGGHRYEMEYEVVDA